MSRGKIENIEDLPFIKIDMRIMKFWALLIDRNWRILACLGPYIFITISQILDLFYSHEAMDAIIRNAYIAVLFFDTTFRGIFISIYHRRFEEFLDKIKILYNDIMDSESELYVKMLGEMVRKSSRLGKVNYFMGNFSSLAFIIYPIVATSKVLPFGIYVPGVDKHASPYYEIFFIFQIIVAPIGCGVFISFTNLLVGVMLFLILMLKIVQGKLRNLQNMPRAQVAAEVKWCIEYQLKIFGIVDTMNALATYLHLVEFLAFGAMLCIMLFFLVIVERIGQTVIVAWCLIMIFSQSTNAYYYAHELYNESLEVARAVYDSNWFDYDVGTQKALQLLMARAQRPCGILVGNVYVMNLELLQSMMNAAYTYFTLLNRVYGDD